MIFERKQVHHHDLGILRPLHEFFELTGLWILCNLHLHSPEFLTATLLATFATSTVLSLRCEPTALAEGGRMRADPVSHINI